jgi:predicted porin
MTLTLRGDDLAELVTTGPSVTDHYNCTTSTNETWYANGTTNTLDQTVTFTSCNFGGFSAEGTISFEDGTLSGYVTCFFKDGSIAVTITVK